ncbi:MAG TPA: PRC-barrel domain-containing protein [Vicinamibacterales bacterium]|nr:PRC-barrel domain-containing protein [Vicinamibacterales bacterium]
MTRRATHLIGKPVVSAPTGERLGTVSDLLLDDAGTSLVGLVLNAGWMKGEHVLPAESVQTLGADAVVSRTSEVFGAKDWHERSRTSERRMETMEREPKSVSVGTTESDGTL